ncbi:MAG: SDR family NAD(P)-dependent oxidoreductase, partial [Actinomycetota bacterium]
MDVTRSLEGRVAIVTGAGQGVGEGIARKLASCGAHIVIAARRAETGEPVAAAIRADGGSAECVVTDVTTRESIAACIDGTVATHGRL